MTDEDRLAIFTIPANANSHTPLFIKDAVFLGSRSAVMERVVDSRARNQYLTIINDAANAKRDLASIHKANRDLAAREDVVTARERAADERDLADAIRKLDAAAARMDALEQEQQLEDPEAELTLPPGVDSGDMQTPIEASEPEDRKQLEEIEEDDEGPGDLPKSLTAKVPPETGTDPDLSGARPPTARNPAAPGW
jgi:hypothetical protein